MQKRCLAILEDGTLNKSVSFSKEEREKLGLRGLLPYSVETQDTQVQRVMDGIRRKGFDIERYILLSSLQERDERLFYKVAIDHIEEIMPLIYTPTVGQASKEFSHIFRSPKGFYITPDDKGDIETILENWPENDIRIIVITDGQRILGLGDLGANGMGIPIGKLALYTACAGIPPHQALPVMLDVGTNNEELLSDPLYLGYPHKRLEGQAYLELVEEFVQAVQKKYPRALIQFEDFLTPNAYGLLNTYRDRILSFNDDIQGTAAVALAGVYASSRITGRSFVDSKVMFLGAGSAATGIADLMVAAFVNEGLSLEEARKRLWFVDSEGLVVASRTDLRSHNLPYAHEAIQSNFIDAIDSVQPHILIGATGAPGTFTQEVIERMSVLNEHPVIFALSNPTSKAECTAEQAYTWSNGKAIFSSGSPFGNVNYNGKVFRPGQGNNAYIFPGLGLGAIIANASIIPDELFLVAAKTLAQLVTDENLQEGALYPRLTEIRRLSIEIAIAVAEKAYKMKIARDEKPSNLKKYIEEYIYHPNY
ncbi:NAD-dependent malic enzyme [Dokdonia pacifica]|uniref:Malate dehydrogenase (Oxaloacetate-decarboxylating)(NADP+) n=1 Tax=Dokdonia pacifica TaxID=1627892 RepID=A0A238ZSC1_9FLAO|nr:NAD-dependent malic enzyme [Dokdonia pacifica]SNR85654.1 malate dehydrogenase (oxaloacetate-decarboxylating)(NADP+) [Dokdonia pacifica]